MQNSAAYGPTGQPMMTMKARGTTECSGMLSPRALTVAGVKGHWVVVECASRHEKRLAQALADAGFDFFLPLVRSVKKSGRTRYVTLAPIPGLNGYVFAASTDPLEDGYLCPRDLFEFLDNHASVYGTIEVSRGAQPQLVREMTELYGMIVNNPSFGEHFAVKGQACRVISGPLQGREGIIDSAGNGWAILPISILKRSVPTKIPVSQLEPIDFVSDVSTN
jgi:transcription antitermination factor NusG